jgi:hypothetical protein
LWSFDPQAAYPNHLAFSRHHPSCRFQQQPRLGQPDAGIQQPFFAVAFHAAEEIDYILAPVSRHYRIVDHPPHCFKAVGRQPRHEVHRERS